MKLPLISESAIRELIRESMTSKHLEQDDDNDEDKKKDEESKPTNPSGLPISPSGVVDPSAGLTDPDNENFSPTNHVELKAAIFAIIPDIPEERISNAWNNFKKFASKPKKDEPKDGELTMKKDTQAESVLRMQIRKIISEMGRPRKVFDPTNPAEVAAAAAREKHRQKIAARRERDRMATQVAGSFGGGVVSAPVTTADAFQDVQTRLGKSYINDPLEFDRVMNTMNRRQYPTLTMQPTGPYADVIRSIQGMAKPSKLDPTMDAPESLAGVGSNEYSELTPEEADILIKDWMSQPETPENDARADEWLGDVYTQIDRGMSSIPSKPLRR